MGKKNPDTSAADNESALQNQEYEENQQEIAEKRKALDDEELTFLHSQGGIAFSDPSLQPNVPPV